MSAFVVIAAGQRWQDRSNPDRVVTVQTPPHDVDQYGNGFVTVRWVRRSQMRVSTLRSRYRLLDDPTH